MLQNHQVQQALRLDVFITLKVGQLPPCSTVFYVKMYRPLTPYFRKTRTTEKKKKLNTKVVVHINALVYVVWLFVAAGFNSRFSMRYREAYLPIGAKNRSKKSVNSH